MQRSANRLSSYIWRSANFQGLTKVADTLEPEAHLALYAAYLRLREQGLRKSAFATLDQFVALASRWPFEQRRDVVDRVMMLKYQWPRVDELVPVPLHQGLIDPTLSEWTKREPTNPVPFRWRCRDNDDLRHAIRLDPQEHIARNILAARLLDYVDYAIHELPYGYIGDPFEDAAALDEVTDLVNHLPAKTAEPMVRQLAELREVVTAYVTYTTSGTAMDFRQWIIAEGLPVARRWKSCW